MGKTGAVALALIVGLGVGYFLGTLSKGGDHGGGGLPGVATCLTPGSHVIDVSLLGAPDCPDTTLSKSNNDSIAWFSPQGTSLWVSIPGYDSNSSSNTARFVIPQTYTPNNTPIAYGIRVFGTGTPTPGRLTPTPPPQTNGRIIIMK